MRLPQYAKRSGRNVDGLPWYAMMAAWKLAVLYEYSHRRGEDPYYSDPRQFERFVETGKRFATLA